MSASREASPRRICVIGNSSVGAVRMALADRQAPSPYDFSFFASGGPKFESVGFVEDDLVGPRSTAAATAIS